jgi:tRNA threonylcarbamoyladenosine biosynthesis protein TsaE
MVFVAIFGLLGTLHLLSFVPPAETPALSVTLSSIDLSQLELFAGVLTQSIGSPTVIGLIGTLGAGKTTLVQAMARSWGIDAAEVTSPTFTLLQTHRVSQSSSNIERIHHLDAYRVADLDEWLELGVEELMEEPGSVTIIEWADRVWGTLPPDAIRIELSLSDQADCRDIHLSGGKKGNPNVIDRIAHSFRASISR